MADAGEHVLEGASGRRVVKDLRRGDERQAMPLGAQDRAGLLLPFLGPAVAVDQGVEAIPEGVFEKPRDERRIGFS